MATPTYFTGDTIRVRGTFRDLSNALIDADGQAVSFKVYNAESRALLSTNAATRSSTGVYYYDYTFPATEQAYIFELTGNFGGKPQLKRLKVKAKFKV